MAVTSYLEGQLSDSFTTKTCAISHPISQTSIYMYVPADVTELFLIADFSNTEKNTTVTALLPIGAYWGHKITVTDSLFIP